MTAPCHVLPYDVAEGPANMALDEAMLDAAGGGAGMALLRTYGWSTPTLSLGYFQRLADIEAEPRWREVPKVRRLSGGGAIWHHHEVTYALAVPDSHPLARPNTKLYRAVHTAIAAALASMGVGARAGARQADRAQKDCEHKRTLLCFAELGLEDVIADRVKLVGSAQRRRKGAVLQHGSVLLARSSLAPELPGVCDLADVPAEPKVWSHRLLERVLAILELHSVNLTDQVDVLRARARELERARYGDPAWTGLR
jgi:lipoate-protein ligase A